MVLAASTDLARGQTGFSLAFPASCQVHISMASS